MDERLLENLRSLGADTDRLPEIPEKLSDYIASLMPGPRRIREEVEELERLGLLPRSTPEDPGRR